MRYTWERLPYLFGTMRADAPSEGEGSAEASWFATCGHNWAGGTGVHTTPALQPGAPVHLSGDLGRVLAEGQHGMASAEHQAFVRR